MSWMFFQSRISSLSTYFRSSTLEEKYAEERIGGMADWERLVLKEEQEDVARGCLKIATRQACISHARRWLRVGAAVGTVSSHECLVMEKAILVVSDSIPVWDGDEASAVLLRTAKQQESWERHYDFDPSGYRARRFLVRTLLSASLDRNETSILHHSFFHSHIKEVNLFPIVARYVVGVMKDKDVKRPCRRHSNQVLLKSPFHVSDILLRDHSEVTDLSLCLHYDNQYVCFFPLLLSHLPGVTKLSMFSTEHVKVDLTFLQQVDTSHLEVLHMDGLYFDSLSPLSRYKLHSLLRLGIYSCRNELEGFHPLNGLSSTITANLRSLEVSYSNIRDISPLSNCDLSKLEHLFLNYDSPLSDLSPLRGSNLSSLKSFHIKNSNHISDFSPLCECKGLVLEELCLSGTSIGDLTPLSLMDLSRLKKPIYIRSTFVSDLSPLKSISTEGVVVYATATPAVKRMEAMGLKSPQYVGKVVVEWCTS